MTATYINPIVPGCYPDPSVCRAGDDYYLAASTFEYFPGVPILHSRDLRHWRPIGHALTRESQLALHRTRSSQGIFAPTLRYHDGTFYMVTTLMEGGRSFLVTARDPTGPWSDPIWIREEAWGMDPSIFFDVDGTVYYTRHGGKRSGGIYQAELDVTTGALTEEPRLIWSGTGGIWPEGPHLYRIDGTYYLMISEGGTSYEHAITVARSRSPWGPFEAAPHNPILTHRAHREHPVQATGHGDLVQASNGTWWMVLLGIRPSDGTHHHLGRETFLAPVRFDERGWPVVNEGRPIELRMSAKGLPNPHPWPAEPQRDDFDDEQLGLAWNFIRNPPAGLYSLSERAGFLRLHGRLESLNDVACPAFVGRRQRDATCTVSTSLEFEPQREEHEAGLVLRTNEQNHYDLVVTRVNGRRIVRLRTVLAGKATDVREEAIGPGPVALSISASVERYAFTCTSSGAAAVALGAAATVPLSSEVAGGFTGVYIGMYASGPAPMPPADFDWFEYIGGQSQS